MSRLLTLFLVLHWALVFSLMAGLAVFAGQAGDLTLFGVQMLGPDTMSISLPLMKAAVSFGFAICAVLFWWAFVTLVASPGNRAVGEDILRLAFAAACGLMTLMLLVGTLSGTSGLFPAMAAHFAALVASYVAVRVERQPEPRKASDNGEVRLAARVQAIDASRTARLARLVVAYDGQRSPDR